MSMMSLPEGHGGNADQIEPLIAAGVCAFKAFLCDVQRKGAA